MPPKRYGFTPGRQQPIEEPLSPSKTNADAPEESKTSEDRRSSVKVPKIPDTMLFDGTGYATWAQDFRELMELYGLWDEFAPEAGGDDDDDHDDEDGLSSRVSTPQSRMAAVVLRSAIRSKEVKSMLTDVPLAVNANT